MKILNLPLDNSNYTEIPQTNPLRWAVLHKDGDNFTYQTGIFKCKDFFNEFVSKYRGFPFLIYGFDSSKMTVNEEGVYVCVRGLLNKECFRANVGSINALAAKKDFPPVEFVEVEGLEDNQEVLFIPRKYFDTTYSISWITYFIRVSNVAVVVTNWANHPTLAVDRPFSNYYTQALQLGPQPPIEGYWYYNFKQYTKLDNPVGYDVHDNGVYGWLNALDCEGAL